MSNAGKVSGRKGFEALVGVTSGYKHVHGIHLKGIFKPFTTDTSVSGVPHYEDNLAETYNNNNGSFGASSSGLNPFGSHTLNEGIIWSSGSSGNDMPTDIEGTINPSRVRALGLKLPQSCVGWGYDIFGHPVPNFREDWNASGVINTTHYNAVPSGQFLGINKNPVEHGSDVPLHFWKSGPVDLRWNNERKVWSPPQSVYSATIKATYIDGSRYNEVTGFYFSELVQYDVQMYDGLANEYTISLAVPVSKRPVASSYKITPLNSGDACFMMHTPDPSSSLNRPMFGVWAYEPPGAEECEDEELAYFSEIGGFSWSDSDGLLTGAQFASGLAANPLTMAQGGTGLDSVASGQMLFVNQSGVYVPTNLIAGSGIDITQTSNNSSGNIEISLGTGMAFVDAGVNSNITEIQGLTTPLTLEQGGTGATGLVYCTIDDTPQSIIAQKTFSSGIILGEGSGNVTDLRLLFGEDVTTGLAYPSGRGFSFIHDSAHKISFSSGLHLNCPLKIQNENIQDNIALEVYNNDGINIVNQDTARFYSVTGTKTVWINSSGSLYTNELTCEGRSITLGNSGSGSVINSSTTNSLQEYSFPENSGTIAVFQGPSGYNGTITVTLVDPVGDHVLNFSHGVLLEVVPSGAFVP